MLHIKVDMTTGSISKPNQLFRRGLWQHTRMHKHIITALLHIHMTVLYEISKHPLNAIAKF